MTMIVCLDVVVFALYCSYGLYGRKESCEVSNTTFFKPSRWLDLYCNALRVYAIRLGEREVIERVSE